MENGFYGQILCLHAHNTNLVTDNNDPTRRSNGSFEQTYQPQDFLNAIAELDDPSTSTIADEIGCSVGTAHRYLTQLAEQGDVDREEKYGAVIWSRSD